LQASLFFQLCHANAHGLGLCGLFALKNSDLRAAGFSLPLIHNRSDFRLPFKKAVFVNDFFNSRGWDTN
jgi:hypothetical protein